MKPPHKLFLAASGLACLACLGTWYFTREPNGAQQVPTSKIANANEPAKASRNHSSTTPATQISSATTALAEVVPGDVQSSRGGATAQFSKFDGQASLAAGNGPIIPPSHIKGSREELAARAAKVEHEANRELERLVPLLNLTPEQQDRVFAKLVENSVYWSPGMTAATPSPGNLQNDTISEAGKGGAVAAQPISQIQNGGKVGNGTANGNPTMTTPTPNVALNPVQSIPDLLTSPNDPILTPQQEADLYTNHLDKQQWWEELVGNIQSDMEGGTTTTEATTQPTDEVPDLVIEGPATIQD